MRCDLTKEEILELLDRLSYGVLWQRDHLRLAERRSGYQEGKIGKLQAKLSIMLAGAP